MGCRKLTYYETSTQPLKVVTGTTENQRKVVQWFISVDPLAGKYAQLTPYNYAGNKPITHKDIEGMQSSGDNKSEGNDHKGSGGNNDSSKSQKENAGNLGIGALPSNVQKAIRKAESKVKAGDTYSIEINETGKDYSVKIHILHDGKEVDHHTYRGKLATYHLLHETLVPQPSQTLIPKKDGDVKEIPFPSSSHGAVSKQDHSGSPGLSSMQSIKPGTIPDSQQPSLGLPASSSTAQSSTEKESFKEKAANIMRETGGFWADLTEKLFKWGKIGGRIVRTLKGASWALGALSLLFAGITLHRDLKSGVPPWIAWTKFGITTGFVIAGLVLEATPLGWGLLIAGFAYSLVEESGGIDKGLEKIGDSISRWWTNLIGTSVAETYGSSSFYGD